MSYKLKEYTKKEQIIIWVCTILTIILSFIGIATIYACFTNKIEIAKAEEEEIYYRINLPNEIMPTPNTMYSITSVGTTTDSNTGNNLFTSENGQVNIYQLRCNKQTNYNTYILVCRLTTNPSTNYNLFISTRNGESEENYTTLVNVEQPIKTALEISENNEILMINWIKNETNYNLLIQNNTQENITIFNKFLVQVTNTIQLETPTITLNLNTIHWENIENADYYNIFKNGNLIGQTQSTQWVTIENGIYSVQACTNNNEEYSNSEISNSITQNNYNDLIGNGVNWFTFFSAFVDSQIYLIKSMTNYTIWDINFFQLFSFIITIILAVIIIKFVKGF